jgi:hypothetical protein
MTEIDPRTRSRRAYESSRIRLGLASALPVVPLVALSASLCGNPALALVLGTALFIFAASLHARGQVYGRAVTPGILAGAGPLLLPLALQTSGYCCVAGLCLPGCMLACIGGGILAGVAIGVTAAAQQLERRSFLACALAVAGLTGALGCAAAGVAGLIGMAITICLTSVPIYFARQSA